MSTKKILAIIGSVIIIGVFIFGVTWSCLNAGKIRQVFSGVNLYTEDDLKDAYQDGYNVAKQDNQALQDTIEKLRIDLDKLNQDKSLLEEEKIDLQNQIKVYEDFIKNSDKLTATFYIDNTVYSIKAYDFGETIYIETPLDTNNYVFNGWLLNGETVDVNSIIITEDLVFEADITYKYEITFNHNYAEQLAGVYGDEIINLSDSEKASFSYNNDKMNINDSVVTSVYGVSGEYLSTILGFNKITIFGYEVVLESSLQNWVSRYICFVVNTGWQINGEEIDIDNYQLTGDVILTPIYEVLTFIYDYSDYYNSDYSDKYSYCLATGNHSNADFYLEHCDIHKRLEWRNK